MTNKVELPETGNEKDRRPDNLESSTADFKNPAALVGQMLDNRFRIEKNLADSGADAGGIGLVYLARDLKLMSREVVVKILQQKALENKDLTRKFQHEKEALIRLDHPNIVRILDSGELWDGNPFMVMEYIPGHSLRRVINEKKKLSLDFAAYIIETVADALTAAHSKQIIHRDIKPENIMLTPQDDGFDRVKIIDFGIARVENSILAPKTEDSRGIGTVLYIAPEQLAGVLEQTMAADIYSFAIVIYEMLTGELPFKPKSIVEMFELQKQGVKTPPRQLRPGLPVAAEKLILTALEFKPAMRPQNARQFGRTLAKSLRDAAMTETDYKGTTEIIEPVDDYSTDRGKGAGENIDALKTNREDNMPATEPATLPAEIETAFPAASRREGEREEKSSKILIWSIPAGILILSAISIPLGLAMWKNNTEPAKTTNSSPAVTAPGAQNAAETGNARELTYFLNVQKMRDDKPYGEPFKSSGQEIFENGYKFKMVFQAGDEGVMYLFNESKTADGKTVYNILYPTPKTNGGSAKISAKQPIETGENKFSGISGTELVWMIWAASEQETIETIKQPAFNNKGAIKDEQSVKTLKDFIEKNKTDNTEVSKDTANRQTTVKGKGDMIIYRIELEHQ